MYFGFTDEQLAFRDAVRDLLEKQCGPDVVRAAWSPASPGYDLELWARLADMGVLGLLGPEDAGGLGMSEVDLVLILEETGRAAMPGPIVEHAAAGVPALASAPAGRRWLPGAVAGHVLVAVSEGADRAVPWGGEADLLVMDRDGTAHAVTADQRTAATARQSVDHSRRAARIDAGRGVPLVGADMALAFDQCALGTAAQLVGVAQRLIEMTVEYAKSRKQFGVPIGTYQAVKHHLANALLKVEYARPCVYRAAYAIAHREPDRSRDVSLAKAYANEAAALAVRVSLQCHGAIGYTVEYDLHLWMKRAWALQAAWGDTAFHRARVAAAVLDHAGPGID